MRLLIVGPGALGTVLCVRLAQAGHAVTVLGRPGTPAGAYPDRFRVEGTDPSEAAVTIHRAGEPIDGFDAVGIAVKSYDLERCVTALEGLDPVPTLLIQNGLGIERVAERGLRAAGIGGWAEQLVRTVVSLPATWVSPGVARQAGHGEFLLPRPSGGARDRAVERWSGLLASAGLVVREPEDFDREIWRKLLVNAAINPVTADHGIPNGRLAEDPWRGQALALLHEARSVAALEGQSFDAAEAERDMFSVVRATASNRSSMLQDLDRGRRTEVEAILGELLRRGEARGLQLPQTRRAVDRLRRRAPDGTAKG